MTTLLTSMGMATWPPAKTWERRRETSSALKAQVSADEEVHESRLQISKNASIRNLTILRSLIKTLFMLVAFALPLLSNTVRLHDDNSEESKEVTAPAIRSATHLARLTAYWPEEGDSYTVRGMSSSGIRLRDGHCAVDPKVIPYGSVVKIPGIGEFVAVDTGPAVVSRRAAPAGPVELPENGTRWWSMFTAPAARKRGSLRQLPRSLPISPGIGRATRSLQEIASTELRFRESASAAFHGSLLLSTPQT